MKFLHILVWETSGCEQDLADNSMVCTTSGMGNIRVRSTLGYGHCVGF